MGRLSLIQHSAPLQSAKLLKTTIDRIAYATDLRKTSEDALAWAVHIAKANEADLLLLHVLPPPVPLFEAEPFEKPEAEVALSLLLARVKATGISSRGFLLTGTDSIGKQIVRAATLEKIDLILMGTQSRSRIFRLLTGSVAANVVAQAQCPVLVIPCKPSKHGLSRIHR